MIAISNELRLGISAASSWAWGTSLVVGLQIAQTKAKALDLIKHPERLSYGGSGAVLREVKHLYVQFGAYWNQKNWRAVYQILIAGDPKKRSLRALRTQSVLNRNDKNAAR